MLSVPKPNGREFVKFWCHARVLLRINEIFSVTIKVYGAMGLKKFNKSNKFFIRQ